MRDAHVAGIMSGEDKLVPETAEEEGRQAVPGMFEEKYKQPKEEGVARDLDSVGCVVTVVQPCCADTLVQLAVSHCDIFLVFCVKRRVFRCIQLNLLLSSSIDHVGSWFGFF